MVNNCIFVKVMSMDTYFRAQRCLADFPHSQIHEEDLQTFLELPVGKKNNNFRLVS